MDNIKAMSKALEKMNRFVEKPMKSRCSKSFIIITKAIFAGLKDVKDIIK